MKNTAISKLHIINLVLLTISFINPLTLHWLATEWSNRRPEPTPPVWLCVHESISGGLVRQRARFPLTGATELQTALGFLSLSLLVSLSDSDCSRRRWVTSRRNKGAEHRGGRGGAKCERCHACVGAFILWNKQIKRKIVFCSCFFFILEGSGNCNGFTVLFLFYGRLVIPCAMGYIVT